MNKKCGWVYILAVVAIVMAASIPGIAGAQTGEEWVHIQNGSQGYALDCPKSAIVRRFDPEGILHIELPLEHRVMTIHVRDNPSRLSAGQWTDRWLSNGRTEVTNQLKTALPVISRDHINIGGQSAEVLVLVGPLELNRRTVLVGGSQVYLIDHPIGQSRNESLFEQIIATFETGKFADDSGFHIIEPDLTYVISSLPVPYYSQADSRWICDKLGTCNCDFGICQAQTYTGIGDAGCFITSQAMIFEYYTTSHFMNPQEFDTCLTNHSGYSSWAGCAYGLCAASYSTTSSCRPTSVTYAGSSTNLAVLDSDLNSGYPAIALTLVSGYYHYVVVTGKSGGNYQIHDPYYSRSQISPGEVLEIIRYHGPLPDSIAPTTARSLSGASGENGWYISNVQVTLSASDNSGGSGVKLIQYRIDSGSWHTYSSPFTVSGDGSHTVYYKSQDNAGNWESEKQVSVRIDTTAPTNPTAVSSGCSAQSGIWQCECAEPQFTWSGADDHGGSGIKEYRVYWGTNPAGTPTQVTAAASYVPAAISPPDEAGTYYLRVATEDQVGNRAGVETLFILRYDGSQPTAGVAIAESTLVAGRVDLQVHLTAADTGSGVQDMRFSPDGFSWSTWQPYTEVFTWTHPAPTVAIIAVYVEVRDGVEHISAMVNAMLSPQAGPHLSLPDDLSAYPGQELTVPIVFTSAGHAIAATSFSVDFDETCLAFDPADEDQDGVPDALSFKLPVDFAGTATFDAHDTDGELDILIMDLFSPLASLSDGTVATLQFEVICQTTPGTPLTATLSFASAPLASFGTVAGQSVLGMATEGSVEILSGTRGDCNGDAQVDAGDISALILEIFDEDGADPLDALGGSFSGDPIGCDANADGVVDAGDLSCVILLIFEGPGMCGSGLTALSLPFDVVLNRTPIFLTEERRD